MASDGEPATQGLAQQQPQSPRLGAAGGVVVAVPGQDVSQRSRTDQKVGRGRVDTVAAAGEDHRMGGPKRGCVELAGPELDHLGRRRLQRIPIREREGHLAVAGPERQQERCGGRVVLGGEGRRGPRPETAGGLRFGRRANLDLATQKAHRRPAGHGLDLHGPSAAVQQRGRQSQPEGVAAVAAAVLHQIRA